MYKCTYHLIRGREVPRAVGHLAASIFNDLSADWDVDHPILPAVGVGWLIEREDAAGWEKRMERSIIQTDRKTGS